MLVSTAPPPPRPAASENRTAGTRARDRRVSATIHFMAADAASDRPPFRVTSEILNKGDLAAFKAFIEAEPGRLNAVTVFGTWLHMAILRHQPAIARYLVDAGIDVNVNAGILKSNSLSVAASEGDLETLKYLHTRGVIFDTSEPTRNPLFGAIYGGHKDVARYLLENGIDHSVAYTSDTMTNMDAFAFATERGQTEIAEMIREFASRA
jgi:ankyrin repeat protein